MSGILIRDAELGGHRTDVRIAPGLISEIGDRLVRDGEEVVEASGGELLPGLCDHHLHLHALAAAERSVVCGPPGVTDPRQLGAALAGARADEHGWVRGVGYSEDVAGALDATALDRLYAARPVRIQHRSGALWMLNSAGIAALRLGDHSGRILRGDDWLRERLPPTRPPRLDRVGRMLAGFGITQVTDATPDLDDTAIDAISADMRSGALPQRVHLLGVPLDRQKVDGPTVGPYKIVLADSGLPDFDELVERISMAHNVNRAVAVHCVTREALALLIAALDRTGTRKGDRIEHAALLPRELVPHIRRIGLAVVTQPGFLADRGDDYLRDVPAIDQPDLYRARSLIDGGVPCALSSDAPYGPVDPWVVMRAAVERLTAAQKTISKEERLTREQALAGYLAPPDDPGGRPREIAVGAPADLVLRTKDGVVVETIVGGVRLGQTA